VVSITGSSNNSAADHSKLAIRQILNKRSRHAGYVHAGEGRLTAIN
jgi:hypothetical protein